MRNRILICAGFLLASGMASADVGIGAMVGTQGYGGDIAYNLIPRVDARLGFATYTYKRSFSESGVDYDGKLKIAGVRALADLNIGLGFRVSGGVVFHDNKVDLTGKPSNNTYNINGTTYNSSDVASLKGRIKFGNGVAPYLGLGWGRVSNAGIGFYADIGAMYQGKATTKLDITCGAALSASQCDQLRADAAAEQGQVENELRRYRWYPVINVGLSVGF
ncbi:hypothetical protein [Viridibacterium curvum]|uniref:Outer membrane protein beta-barrel domain-containing protein n=1 Tax=Viridibacterium curvum TaxID=1101404 RepID=A0ABP9QJB5_9RHOO